ncbi:MAG: hypothetical protein HDS02_00190 [Bacteroides sp.]|nr:hypothetical protein [Bacteroides sp.]
MATLKAVVRKQRADGFYAVYIRIVHRSRMGYIKTNKIVDAAHITKTGEITDSVVNEYCSYIIQEYSDRLNRTDVTLWDVKEVIEHLTTVDEEVSFSKYERNYISRMEKNGHARTAKNYMKGQKEKAFSPLLSDTPKIILH